MDLDRSFPAGLAEFSARFSTEAACARLLRKWKYPDGFRCPRCTHDDSWWLAKRRVEECARCGHQVSLTAGTVFHGTRRPLRLWFLAMFLFVSSKQGISALELSRQLGLSYPCAWTWLQKLRSALGRRTRDLLDGFVETDETYVGGLEPGRRGRAAISKTLVGAAVEIPPTDRGFGRARLWVLPDSKSETLRDAIRCTVHPTATLLTDGLPAYNDAAAGRKHHVVVIRGSGLKAHRVLPGVHRVFSLLHRVLDGTYQGAARRKHLTGYIQEFEFRFNRRTSASRGLLFQRLLELAVGHRTPPYWKLIGRVSPSTPLAPAA